MKRSKTNNSYTPETCLDPCNLCLCPFYKLFLARCLSLFSFCNENSCPSSTLFYLLLLFLPISCLISSFLPLTTWMIRSLSSSLVTHISHILFFLIILHQLILDDPYFKSSSSTIFFTHHGFRWHFANSRKWSPSLSSHQERNDFFVLWELYQFVLTRWRSLEEI